MPASVATAWPRSARRLHGTTRNGANHARTASNALHSPRTIRCKRGFAVMSGGSGVLGVKRSWVRIPPARLETDKRKALPSVSPFFGRPCSCVAQRATQRAMQGIARGLYGLPAPPKGRIPPARLETDKRKALPSVSPFFGRPCSCVAQRATRRAMQGIARGLYGLPAPPKGRTTAPRPQGPGREGV
jgi:hypothetical protein